MSSNISSMLNTISLFWETSWISLSIVSASSVLGESTEGPKLTNAVIDLSSSVLGESTEGPKFANVVTDLSCPVIGESPEWPKCANVVTDLSCSVVGESWQIKIRCWCSIFFHYLEQLPNLRETLFCKHFKSLRFLKLHLSLKMIFLKSVNFQFCDTISCMTNLSVQVIIYDRSIRAAELPLIRFKIYS